MKLPAVLSRILAVIQVLAWRTASASEHIYMLATLLSIEGTSERRFLTGNQPSTLNMLACQASQTLKRVHMIGTCLALSTQGT